MPEIAISAESRNEMGSSVARRLRREGRIPAIVYGHGISPLAVSVGARELRSALSTSAGENALFELSLGSERHLVIARDVQRHPVRHTVSHVDFQVVRRDEVVPADVPVQLVGEALGVTRQGGTVEHALLSMHLRAKPADIPSVIEVDISGLELGSSIRIGDIELPDGVSIDLDPETPIAVGQAPRGQVAEGEEAAGTGETSSDEATNES